MKFSKEAQIWNVVATILNSTQQPGGVFVKQFCPRDDFRKNFKLLVPLRVMAALEPYYFKPDVLQTSK